MLDIVKIRRFYFHPPSDDPERLPSREELYAREERRAVERDQVWHVFACIRLEDLPALLSRGGLSLYEVARAIHLSKTLRPHVVAWLNQFGARPDKSA